MSKGASQTGTQTTTSVDPRVETQTPYVTRGWQDASTNLDWQQANRYPQGYTDYYNASVPGGPVSQSATAAYAPFQAGTSGAYSGYNSPAYGGYQNVSTGNTYGQQLADSSAGQGYSLAGTAAPAGQKYADLLSDTASGTTAALADPLADAKKASSGYYLNSNPYLDAMYKSASDATTSAYQTATAPRTDSSYALAGRYGSGVLANAQTQDKLALGKTLANEAADIYGKSYASERGLQNQATTDYGKLAVSGQQLQQTGYNYAGNQALAGIDTGQRGYSSAGNLGLGGTTAQTTGLAGLQSGYNTGNQAALDAAKLLPTIQTGQLAAPAGEVYSINGLNQQLWDPLNAYNKIITTPPGYQNTTSTQPVYGSSAAQTLGGLGSLASGGAALYTAFSDRRLKEDTRVVGRIGKLPLHTFRYRGERPGTRRIGFMADEVARIDPGAVRATNLGFAAVDYGRAAASALE